MRITVLAGGPDTERDVSFTSGRAVAAALIEAGHTVHLADATPDDLSALDVPRDVVFPAMHGNWGEGGPLQAELERRGIPFVGSGSHASKLAMDKAAAKAIWQRNGLPTPAYRVVTEPGLSKVPGPCVVKANTGGSSIDCFLRPGAPECDADVREPVEYLLSKYGKCLVEQLVDGYELTVGILSDTALPPIWVDSSKTVAGWFDYKAKYSNDDSAAAHRFDLPPVLNEADVLALQSMCLEAHHALGCRDLSRVDVMLDRTGQAFLLEVNTMPGFTGRSLLPDAAKHAGISFVDLCDRLVRNAVERNVARAA